MLIQKVKVEVLGEILEVEIEKNDTVNILSSKLLEQIDIIPHPTIVIYIDGDRKEKDDCITFESRKIIAKLSKLFEISTFHQTLGDIKFTANYYDKLSSFEDYIYKLPSFGPMKKYQKDVINLIVNGQKFNNSTTIWYEIGPENDLQIQVSLETYFYINWQKKKYKISYDPCQPMYEVIQIVSEQLNIQDVIMLKMNTQTINPHILGFNAFIPQGSYCKIKQPRLVKYRILSHEVEFEVKINKDSKIANLESKVAQKLRLELNENEKLQLKYRDKYLNPNLTIKQAMITYNSLLTCDNKIMLSQNSEENTQQKLFVHPKQDLKELDLLNRTEVKENQQNSNYLDMIKQVKGFISEQLKGEEQQLPFQPVNQQNLQKTEQQLTIHFYNTDNYSQFTTQVRSDSQIRDYFLQILVNEKFTELSDYSIFSSGCELDPNLTYDQAKLMNESMLRYSCRMITVFVQYQNIIYPTVVQQSTRLISLEDWFMKEHKVHKSYTIFHSELEQMEEKSIKEIQVLLFQFKQKESTPVQIMHEQKFEKITPKSNFQPKGVEVLQDPLASQFLSVSTIAEVPSDSSQQQISQVLPQKIKIVHTKITMMKFNIFITNLEEFEYHEVGSKNELNVLAIFLRAKYCLPENQRVIFKFQDKFIDDGVCLENIFNQEDIIDLQATFSETITVIFQEKSTNQVITTEVILAERLQDTIMKLNIENAIFFHNDKQLNQLDISYDLLLVMHNGTIYFERKHNIAIQDLHLSSSKIQKQIAQQPHLQQQMLNEQQSSSIINPDQVELFQITVKFKGQKFLCEVGLKTTISDLRQQFYETIAFQHGEKEQSYRLYYQDTLLSGNIEILNLKQKYHDVILSYVEIDSTSFIQF